MEWQKLFFNELFCKLINVLNKYVVINRYLSPKMLELS